MTREQQQAADLLRATLGYGDRRIADALGLSRKIVRGDRERRQKTTVNGVGLPAGQPTFRTLVWDIECTNLKSDLGVILCAAFYDLADGSIVSRTIDSFGDRAVGERALVLWIKEQVAGADCLIGHNETTFDRNYVNGVLGRYGLDILPKRIHIDTYLAARYGWTGLPSSYSLRNLSALFGLSEEKESLDKDQWRTALTDPVAMAALRVHCERDVAVTALLWQRLKGAYFNWRGR